jgi:hypothetical protein
MSCSPSVSCSINSRERNAAIEDLEVWLVLQHQSADGARRHRLSEPDDRIVVNDSSLLKPSRKCRDTCCSCQELDNEGGKAKMHRADCLRDSAQLKWPI